MSAPRVPRPGTTGLPPADAHAPRAGSGSLSDPNEILKGLPMGTSDYIRVLGAILLKHNHQHSAKHKGVSFKTMKDRQQFLAGFFREIRHKTRFNNLDPRQLATRHVEVMVARWLERDLSTATLHNYLSFLRTYAGWIGKPGLVRLPEYYFGAASVHSRRVRVATEDRSWSAKHIDVQAKIAEISAFDRWIGLQVELCHHFAARGKEARHFRPHGAVIPREHANPRDAEPFPEVDTFVRISHGTKGGRPRDVPLTTDAQRELLERCCKAVAAGMYVGWPGLTSLQARARFYYVVRKFGISKKDLGVVSHGLRHQRVNDGFEQDAGAPSPVRGATTKAADDKRARTRAARVLGHNRLEVTSCYLGSSRALSAAAVRPADAASDVAL